MKIIDAQVHIWSKTVTPTTGLHRKVEKFTAEELLMEMDEAGVDAALIHPPLRLGSRFQRAGDRGGAEISGSVRGHGPVSRSTCRRTASSFMAGATSRA